MRILIDKIPVKYNFHFYLIKILSSSTGSNKLNIKKELIQNEGDTRELATRPRFLSPLLVLVHIIITEGLIVQIKLLILKGVINRNIQKTILGGAWLKQIIIMLYKLKTSGTYS